MVLVQAQSLWQFLTKDIKPEIEIGVSCKTEQTEYVINTNFIAKETAKDKEQTLKE